MKTRPWIEVAELEQPANPEAINAIMAASLVLFSMSGQKYGGVWTTTEQYTCETTGAPAGCSYDPGQGGYWNPTIGAYTYVLGRPPGPRTGGPGGDIRLRGRPVRQITQVSVNGVVVDPSQYELLNRAILRPKSGMSWGLCSSPVITYDYGTEPPVTGKIAARKLADEFVLAFNGDDRCSLPSNVTSVARQGLSFSIFDSQDFLDKGLVGIYEVDLFLRSVNPSRAAKRPRVFSPDLPRAYRRS